MIWLLACGGDKPIQEQSTEGVAVIENVQEESPLLIRTQVWPKEPSLGDAIHLKLIVESTVNQSVELPPFGEALGRFEIVDFRPRQSQDSSGYIWSQEYTLQPMNSGLLTIPSLRVTLNDSQNEKEWLTEEIPLKIASILPEDGRLEFQPYREKLPKLWKKDPMLWSAGIASALCLIGLGLWYFRPRKKDIPQQNPWEEAQIALNTLQKQQSTISDEELLQWISTLSFVLRRYLQRRFHVNALEQTTEELSMHLPDIFQQEHISQNIHQKVMAFLVFCDEMKFAQAHYQKEVVFAQLDFVQNFIRDTFPTEVTQTDAMEAVP